jgi:5-methylcytosine-specific restriction endonuclease McrA
VQRTPYNSVHWHRLRASVLRRDKHTCYWCKGKGTTVDHLRSISEGGQPYDPANLVAACLQCNSSRGAEVLKAKQSGSFLGARRRLDPLPSMHVHDAISGAIRV